MGGRQWIGGKPCFFYILSKNKCIPLMLQSRTHTQDLFLQQSVTTRRLDDSAGHSNTAQSLGKCVCKIERGGKNEDRGISAVQLCDFISFLTASKLSVNGQNGFCQKYNKSLKSGNNYEWLVQYFQSKVISYKQCFKHETHFCDVLKQTKEALQMGKNLNKVHLPLLE